MVKWLIRSKHVFDNAFWQNVSVEILKTFLSDLTGNLQVQE
jgi:hypothetical protein